MGTKSKDTNANEANLASADKPIIVAGGTPPRLSRTQAAFLIILVIALITLGMYIVLKWRKTNATAKKSPSTTLSIQEQKHIVNNTDVSSVVQTYGKSQDVITKEVQASNPNKWDKTMLDKAYFSLLYYDKVGDFSHVNQMLFMISLAQKSGLNIDNNSFGVNQKARDAMQLKASQLAQKKAQGTKK
jgi:hypothetical protein